MKEMNEEFGDKLLALRSQLAHRQTAPLPPAAPLPLHLELRVHELRLHPGAFLLVLAHGGAVEEVGEVGDGFRCDDGGEGEVVVVAVVWGW